MENPPKSASPHDPTLSPGLSASPIRMQRTVRRCAMISLCLTVAIFLIDLLIRRSDPSKSYERFAPLGYGAAMLPFFATLGVHLALMVFRQPATPGGTHHWAVDGVISILAFLFLIGMMLGGLAMSAGAVAFVATKIAGISN